MIELRPRIVIGVFVIIIFSLLSFCAQTLEFDRHQILTGEVWRLWTGHLVHANLPHFTFNVLSALILYFGLVAQKQNSELLCISFIFMPIISTLLLIVNPALFSYTGLSGLLHALIAYFSVQIAMKEQKIFWIVVIGLWVKIFFEMDSTLSGITVTRFEMVVATEAHFIGVVIGNFAALIVVILRQPTQYLKTP